MSKIKISLRLKIQIIQFTIILKAMKRNHKFVKAYNNRGSAYVGKEQYDLAIADFNKANKYDPQNGKIYNNGAGAGH